LSKGFLSLLFLVAFVFLGGTFVVLGVPFCAANTLTILA